VAKETGLYIVSPTAGDPATWNVERVTPKTGICGARAVDITDGTVFFVHRTGAYLFDGSAPTWVSDELIGYDSKHPGVWERINWKYDHLIWVDIDHEHKVVRIGIPLDGATQCSHVLKVSYLDGWERDIRFSPFTGRFHFFPGRRWSLDTIAATQAVQVSRPVAQDAIAADRRQGEAQILFGGAGGTVMYPDLGSDSDNGQPINWVFRFGSVSAAQLLKQMRQGMETVGLVQVRATGSGNVKVEYVQDGGDPVQFMTMEMAGVNSGDYRGLALAQGENVQLRFSNGGAASLRLASVYAFCKPTWSMRPGK
jgi:hypothetical protein